MPLSPEDYARYGIQDASDVEERAAENPWPKDQTWDLDGAQVTEEEFQRAWAHFEKTGESPDWWSK